MWIDYTNPFSPFGPFGGVFISPANTGFTVTSERVGFSGQFAQALGNVELRPTDDGLTIADLGPQGSDGVSFDLNRAADARLSFAPLDPQGLVPDGAFLQADLTGSMNGEPDQPLGMLKMTRQTQGALRKLDVNPDFSALGLATYRAEVYDQGVLVTAAAGRTGSVKQGGINTVVVWPVGLEALPGSGFSVTWPSAGTIEIPGGLTVAGDELRILPESNSFITIDNLSGFTLRAAGLPEITVTAIQTTSCLSVITRQPVDVMSAAGRPAVFSVAVDSSNPVTYRWRRNGAELADGDRISGASTATLTLPHTVLSQAGTYDVVVSNACGPVVSESAVYRPGVALRSLLLALGRDVLSLVNRGFLSTAQGDGLSTPLLKALAFLRDDNTRAAANRVDVFIARVNAFVRAGALSSSQGQATCGCRSRCPDAPPQLARLGGGERMN